MPDSKASILHIVFQEVDEILEYIDETMQKIDEGLRLKTIPFKHPEGSDVPKPESLDFWHHEVK